MDGKRLIFELVEDVDTLAGSLGRGKATHTIEEMKTTIRDGSSIEASGRNKDDRVIATALACAAYAEQVQPRLINQKLTRRVSRVQDEFTPEQLTVGRNVSDYLKRIGVYGNSTGNPS